MSVLQKIIYFFSLLSLVCIAGGCQSEISCRQPGTQSAVPEPETIRIFNWEDYLAPDTLRIFTERTGIRVDLETFPDQEYMLARLQSEPGKFDVIFPSHNMLCRLIELKLLTALTYDQLPHYAQVAFDRQHIGCDPDNRYYIPYLMGTTGLAYNKKFIKKKVTSWRDLLDPQYGRRAALLNNVDEVLAIAFKLKGLGVNTDDPAKIRAAGKKIQRALPHMRGFLDPIRIRDLLIAEELVIAHVYSGEGHMATHENPNVVYVIPQEGCVKWTDLMAIPATAPHPEAALRFIDYMMEPAVNASCAQFLRYTTPNQAARAILQDKTDKNQRDAQAVDERGKCEYFDGLETSRIERNRVWSALNKRP